MQHGQAVGRSHQRLREQHGKPLGRALQRVKSAMHDTIHRLRSPYSAANGPMGPHSPLHGAKIAGSDAGFGRVGAGHAIRLAAWNRTTGRTEVEQRARTRQAVKRSVRTFKVTPRHRKSCFRPSR